MTIHIPLLDSAYTITVPTYAGGLVDTFASYLKFVIAPALRVSAPNLFAVRCAVTGFPIATYLDSEIDALLINVGQNTGLSAKIDESFDLKDVDVIAAVQQIVEDLEVRLVMLSKRSPLLSFQKDRLSLAGLDKPRQLAILLNMLLWDAGMFRESFKDSDEHYTKLRRTFSLADHVLSAWNESTALLDLHAALVELDAKYSIRGLRLTRKENDSLVALRAFDGIDVAGLTAFVLRLIAYRDVHQDLDLTEERWSQRAYKANMLSAASREAKSNLIVSIQTNSVTGKKPGLKVWFAAKKPVKPVSEVRGKADTAVDSLFGSLGEIKF